MKIIHLNNIASVAETISGAQKKYLGYESEIINIIPHQKKFSTNQKILTIITRIKLVLAARKFIAKLKPDIVHIHYSTSALWMIGIKNKIIVHSHGSDIRIKKHNIIKFFLNYIGLINSKFIVCSTPDLLQYSRLFRKLFIYIPNPIDCDVYVPLPKHLNKSDVRILLLAIPSHVKGFNEASKAIIKLVNNYPNIKISIFRNQLSESFFKKNPHKNLLLIDIVSQEFVPDLIAQHDIVLGQFFLGSFGMSELQALSCGKILVCNAINNSSYLSPNVYFQAVNSFEIVNQIEVILNSNDDDLQMYRNSARQWVLLNHCSEIIANKLDSLYKKL